MHDTTTSLGATVGDRPTPADRPGVVLSIQYLRAFAALLVVFHHARNPHDWLFNPMADVMFGTRGVDIFFVISGFIMFTAARNEAVGSFAWRRFVRVVPLYWLATLAFLAVSAVAGKTFLPFNIARSLLLIPYANPTYDGAVWPILVPGWTLMYEMFFYALFAVALVTRRLIATLTIAIVGLVVLGQAAPSADPAWSIYTNPLLLEFLCGLWLGIAYRRFDMSRLWPLLPLGLFALPATEMMGLPTVESGMASAVMIVAGALGLEHWGRVPTWRVARILGDASYSIYLSHTLIIMVLSRVIKVLPLSGWPQFLVMVFTTLVASAIGGVLVHRHVERPLLRNLLRVGSRASA